MFAAVLMVTVLTAATGDNIADAVLGQIDFSHNGINNPGAASLNSAEPDGSRPERLHCTSSTAPTAASSDGSTPPASPTANRRTSKSASPIFKPRYATAEARAPVACANPAAWRWTASAIFMLRTPATIACSNTISRSRKQIGTVFAANLVFGQSGSFTQAACAQTASRAVFPQGLASDSNDNLYVADAGNHRVLEFNQPLATPNADTGAGDATADLVFGQGASGTDFADQCVRYRCGQRHGRRDVQSPVGGGRRLWKSVRRRRRRPSRARIQSAAGSARSRHRGRRRNRRPGFWPGLERNRFH